MVAIHFKFVYLSMKALQVKKKIIFIPRSNTVILCVRIWQKINLN